MFPVLFLIILGGAHGNEVDSAQVFNDSSGHFFVYNNQSIKPDTNWTAIIEPINATNIFIVIEKMILDKSDTLTVISGSETLKTMNGTQDPFSLFADGASLKIVIETSNLTVARMFIGYYTNLGCIYEVNDTIQMLSTPLLHTKDKPVNCSFSLVPQLELLSKISVKFLEFQLKNNDLQVIMDGTQHYNYSGDSIPPEIIADKLEFHFMLSTNDTAKFASQDVLKDSKYVELKSTMQSSKLTYMPSPEKEYLPSGEECHWVIKSEENTTISFKFLQVSLSGITHIIFNNGKNQSSGLLFQASSNNENILQNRQIASSGNFLWISIVQPDKNTLVLGEVTMHRNGGYRKGSGELSIPLNSTEVIYLLEDSGKNVVLDEHKGSLTSNSTIRVYSDFTTDSLPIMIYNTSLPHYPIVSSTSRMMVVASNFTQNANYKATFKGINEGCYKMSTHESGEYSLSGNCNTSCKWIVPPVEDMDKVISLRLHPGLFEEEDITTLNLLDAAQTLITNITSRTNILPEFYLPLSSGFLLNSTRGNCSASNNMLHATFEKRKGCSTIQKLKSGSKLSVSSPNFPDSYPFWAHCWTNVTLVNGTKNGYFLLTFSKVDLAKEHCLRIRHDTGHSSEIIKTYEGAPNTLPGDLIVNDNVSFEFLAQPCNSTKKQPLNLSTSSGFSLEILLADCGGKIEKEVGNFSTPNFPKNTSAVICTWILEVPKNDNIINFTVTRNDSKDYELEIYDGLSIHNETLKNHSASTILSRTNTLIFVYRRNNSSLTSPGIRVAFHSQACSARCMNGLCLHDDWKCNKINDCGDNSDEIDCESVPIVTTTPAPPAPKSNGVSPVALGLGIPIAFIVGIVAAIYLPPLIRRFRSGQYHQFRDVSADA